MQLFAADHITQDVPIGLSGFVPAQPEGVRAQGRENQRTRGTGGAENERGSWWGGGGGLLEAWLQR